MGLIKGKLKRDPLEKDVRALLPICHDKHWILVCLHLTRIIVYDSCPVMITDEIIPETLSHICSYETGAYYVINIFLERLSHICSYETGVYYVINIFLVTSKL